MLHTVQVGSFRGDLIAAMSNIMTWLSTRGSEAVFRQAPGTMRVPLLRRLRSDRLLISESPRGALLPPLDGTAFCLEFSSEAEALAFVCAFGGRFVPQMPEGFAARTRGHPRRVLIALTAASTASHPRPDSQAVGRSGQASLAVPS